MENQKPDAGAELGRKLGKALKRARPTAERLVAEAKPRAEKALTDAVQFAKEHEDEGRQIAQQLVRARLTGPLGMVVGALASEPQDAKPTALTCGACQTQNPLSANFCNNCGSRLQQPG